MEWPYVIGQYEHAVTVCHWWTVQSGSKKCGIKSVDEDFVRWVGLVNILVIWRHMMVKFCVWTLREPNY